MKKYTNLNIFVPLGLIIFIGLNVWMLVAELLKASKAQAAETGEKDKGALQVVIMMVVFFIYTLVLPVVTYIPAAIVLLMITMWMFNERRKVLLVAMPVGFTMFLYLVFTYALKISLP